jgi:hypothetical protein
MREVFSPEEGHERGRERIDALIERFERTLATDGIAQEHDYKVNQIVMAKSASDEAHPLFNRRKHTQVPKVVSSHSDFPKPGRGRRNRLR